jgi:crotonobetainyl-CoA:carnitine CoA-transferase CaiB-like acyl-CoA transferase
MANSADQPALHGIRVLDFGHIVAGPFCARILADLGAEVVKVETSRRQGQTGARRGDAAARGRHGRPPLLAHINRNRRSVDLDLKSPSGQELGYRLAAAADVVIENFSAGVMERLGLGYRALQAANPRLVYASMSGYGHTGPRRAWTSMNVNLQAHCGLMMATGAEGDPPIGISNSWNDYMAGLHAALAIIGALAERERTGRGRHLDVSQFEACVATLGSLVLASSVTGIAPERPGNRSEDAAPQGCYPCAGTDEWCALSVRSDDEWRSLATELLADIPLLGDARFARLADRRAAHAEIDAALSAWSRQFAAAVIEARLKSVGLHAESVRRADSMIETAEWQSLLRPMEDPPGHEAKVVGLPFAFGLSAAVKPVAASRIGEDTEAVLRDWLGITSATAAGAVG